MSERGPATNAESIARASVHLRPHLVAIKDGLAARGWLPYVMTWRTLDTQHALFASGKSHVDFSFHNAVDPAGRPAALAADFTDTRWLNLPHASRAAFYRDLGALAHERGLVWGGDWSRSDATFAAPPYEMGWDPAHVQLLPNSKLAEVRARTMATLRSRVAVGAGMGLGALLLIGGIGVAYYAFRR